MSDIQHFLDLLPTINDSNFADIALSVFRFQYKNNVLYRTYSQAVRKVPEAVNSVHDIPFLPIRFFKTHHVISGIWKPETEFTSSATTGAMVSKHSIENLSFYKKNATTIFNEYYGAVTDYHFLALLPSYLERSGSSLIAMIDHFIKTDNTGHSGFYLNDDEELLLKIDSLRASHKRTMLWGVSFALLDLAEKHKIDLSHCIVMETGGMKGRRKEWVREELHQFLCERFKVKQIHSEYGMTELLSQAYSTGWGYFRCPPWMKVLLRDINDPFSMAGQGKVGAINVIDLANVHSCAFIETEDLGRLKDESFEVLGRMDNSDVRGCNLLIG